MAGIWIMAETREQASSFWGPDGAGPGHGDGADGRRSEGGRPAG